MNLRVDSNISVVLRIIPLVVLILILIEPFSPEFRCTGILSAQTSSTDFRSRSNVRSVSPQIPSVQQTYPAFGKIIGHPEETTDELNHSRTVYYGSGVYVAELNDLGIVITNWHVVSDAKASIQVKFPNYESDGVVVLADDVWDLAAIAIKKPPFLPVPISLEVPQIDEKLWVGGYGQYPGLNGFKIQQTKVTRYMVLGTQEGLPAETLALDAGVRQGDSGGPILNRYGELSGLLWGSDGKVTMGTFSLRLQAFLTQAQFQLFNQPTRSNDFVKRSMKQYPPKMIQMATTPAQAALQTCGIFPISTKPVYVLNKGNNLAANGVNASIPHTSAEEGLRDMPPYPPVESPTLIAQRSVIGRDHPEVYPENMLKKNTEFATAQSNDERRDQTESRKDATWHNVSLTTGSQTTVADSAPSTDSTAAKSNSSPSVAIPANDTNLATKTEKSNNPSSSLTFSLSDARIIFVVFILFFLFFNAVRLLAIAHEK